MAGKKITEFRARAQAAGGENWAALLAVLEEHEKRLAALEQPKPKPVAKGKAKP